MTHIPGIHLISFSVAQLFSVMSQGQPNAMCTSKGYTNTASLGTNWMPRDT